MLHGSKPTHTKIMAKSWGVFLSKMEQYKASITSIQGGPNPTKNRGYVRPKMPKKSAEMKPRNNKHTCYPFELKKQGNKTIKGEGCPSLMQDFKPSFLTPKYTDF